MGAFDNLFNGVAGVSKSRDASPSSSSGGRGGGSGRPDRLSVWEQKKRLQREAIEEDLSGVQKQEVNRRARLPGDITEAAADEGGVGKPYDPELLRDLAQNPIVQTYIDTLAQDTASANWKLRPRDEDADLPPELIARAERRFENLFPDLTTEQALELVARNVLELGDAVVVKHFTSRDRNRVEEAVPIDSATFFKRTDEDNFTEGYLQVTQAKDDFQATPFDLDEVIWFSWAGRPNHIYGHSPVEKGQDTIEILEEVADKEILDLVQGMSPGIISRATDEDGSTLVDEGDWENFKDDMRLTEGERHRLAYTKYPVDYTPLSSNYQELQLLDRYKSKITELGGVMKVNPSYAGFEFENVNRATDESQREAYKQRGFRVLLRVIETGLNMGLVPYLLGEEDLQEFSDTLDVDPEEDDVDAAEFTDLVFEFEREQTVGEKKEKARMLQESVEAAGAAADRGLDVTLRDGFPEIEDGPVEESDEPEDGGGLFFSADGRPEEVEKGSDLTQEDVREAYRVAGNEENYSPEEAESPVVLTFPPGGVPYSAEAGTKAWEALFRDLLDRGADAILDLYSKQGAADLRAFPDSLPSDHDPAVAVYGLSEEGVQNVVDLHPDVSMSARQTDPGEVYKNGGGPGN